MSTQTITRDEWLKALTEAGFDDASDDPSALTVAEFGEMVGLKREAATRRLHMLVEKGLATRTKKRCQAADGRVIISTAYRLTAPTKRK